MKPVFGYDGIYEIDDDGLIYSVSREYVSSSGKKCKVNGKLRKPINHSTGYCVITLSNNGKAKTHRYHRIVALSLIDNKDNKPFVNHIDGNKRNNHPSNLEWATEKDNSAHAVETGLFDVKGIKNPSCRFTYNDVSDWYFLIVNGVMIKDIAREWGCSLGVIGRLIKTEFGDVIPEYRGKKRYP